MGTRTVSQTINLQTPDQTSKYISADDSGLMIYDGREGTQEPSNPSATTNNVFIDDNSLDIRRGSDVLATFGTDGARIGKAYEQGASDNESHMVLDYHSLQMIDKENNTYLYISDLQDADGYVTDTFIGDGVTGDFYLTFFCEDTNDYIVTIDGIINTNCHIYSPSGAFSFLEFYADMPPNLGEKIVIKYKTSNAYAYTLGTRNNTIPIGKYSTVIGENLGANGNHQTVIGKYNKIETLDWNYPEEHKVFIIGNGTSSARSNALTVDWSGNVEASGTIEAGKYTANTAQSQEFQVKVKGGAGTLYMYSHAATTGNRGIYGFNSAGTAISVLTVDQNNTVTLNGTANKNLPLTGGTLTGALTVNGTITSGGHIYTPNACYFQTKNTGGTYRIVAGLNSSNQYLFGYSGYVNNEGTSYFDGNTVQIRSKNNVTITVKDSSTNVYTNGYYSAAGSYSETTSSSSNLHVASGGKICRSTASSRRYKTDIQKLSEGSINAHRLYKLPVVEFKYKEGHITDENDRRRGIKVPGFIAEDVAKIYPVAAEYVNGQVEDWSFRYIVPPMLKLIQEQHEEIEQLKKEVQELKNK